MFVGNLDNSGLKVNLFDLPLEVQYVRLVPTLCHRSCTLRFELLGCELNGECWRLWSLPPLLSAIPPTVAAVLSGWQQGPGMAHTGGGN